MSVTGNEERDITPELGPQTRVFTDIGAYNSLRYGERAKLMAGTIGVSAMELTDPEVELLYDHSDLVTDDAYERFWGDEGNVAPLPLFMDVVKEAVDIPIKYNKIIQRNFGSMATKFRMRDRHLLADQPYLSEAESLIQLDEYLRFAHDVSQQTGDEELAEKTTLFHDNIGYLSEFELDRGCGALADLWVADIQRSVQDGKSKHINVYVGDHGDGKRKSYNYIADKVQEALSKVDETLKQHIHFNPDQWKDGDDSILVVLDDWVISGKSVESLLHRAMHVATEKGLEGLKTEVHTIARDASSILTPGTAYRSVFLHDWSDTDHAESLEDPLFKHASMFGSHGIVNIGFDWQLRDIQRSLQEHHVVVPAPIFMNVEPIDYRTEQRDTALRLIREDPQLIERLMSVNGEFIENLRRLTQVDLLLTTGHEATGEILNQDKISQLRQEKKAIETWMKRTSVDRAEFVKDHKLDPYGRN